MPKWRSIEKVRGGPKPAQLRFAIRKDGGLFPSSIVRDWLEKPQYVEVLIDKEERLLGIRRTDSEGGYRVVYSKTGGVHISARTALRLLGVEIDRTHYAVPILDEESGVAYICVDDLVPKGGSG